MMPGRSLSVNTTGRSWAPAATTTCRARMRQTRCRLIAAGASAPRWSVRRSQREDEAVVVVAERGGALQVQHVGVGRPVRRPRRRPSPAAGRAVDGVGAAEQRAAGLALLVDEHHPRAGAGRGQRGGQPGGPGADHQHVGVHVRGVVAGGVGDLGEPALPGDAAGDQPVVQLDGGGQQHRLGEGLLDLDQAAGVLGPRRGDAAGPAQLDAGGDLVHAVGQQRRGQGVAGVPGQFPAVEGEGVRACRGRCGRRSAVRKGAFIRSAGFCSSRRYTRWNR